MFIILEEGPVERMLFNMLVGKMRSSIKRSPGGRRWDRVGGKY